MVWTRRSGPLLKALLIRFSPMPGMLTHRSRGIDRICAWVVAGITRTNMIVSDRAPPTSAALPNWEAAAPVLPARLSLPTTRMVIGAPGGAGAGVVVAGPPAAPGAKGPPTRWGMTTRLIWPTRQLT